MASAIGKSGLEVLDSVVRSNLMRRVSRGEQTHTIIGEHCRNRMNYDAVSSNKTHLDFTSSDCYQLSKHPQVTNSINESINRYGVLGHRMCDGGYTIHHRELEQLVARLHSKPACLILSDFDQVYSRLFSLSNKDDVFMCTSHLHKVFSANQSGARVIQKTLSKGSLEHSLKRFMSARLRFLLLDSVQWVKRGENRRRLDEIFSPLNELSSLLQSYSAVSILDIRQLNFLQHYLAESYPFWLLNEADLLIGSFEALGYPFGFVCGSSEVIDGMRLVDSGTLPPVYLVKAAQSVLALSKDDLLNDHLRNLRSHLVQKIIDSDRLSTCLIEFERGPSVVMTMSSRAAVRFKMLLEMGGFRVRMNNRSLLNLQMSDTPRWLRVRLNTQHSLSDVDELMECLRGKKV